MNYPTFLFVSALTCLTAGSLQADEVIATSESTAKEKAPLTPAQIDELLAPIALYPDPLIAIILPAATFPTDVVMAARYLKEGGSTTNIEAQDWDDSVKALARYPDVVKWMDENLSWTKQLGSVFVLQPAAVLSGTQRLRTEAIAAGNLKTTPQQTVVVEREVVRIVPAQREIIYVPVYDPVYVYRPRPVVGVYYPGSVISFSIGYPAGYWLSYDCNWGLNTVVVIGRPYRTVVWNRYPTWHYPRHTVVYHQPWRPSPVCVQTVRREFNRRPDHSVSRPTSYSHYQSSQERSTPSRNLTRTDDRRETRSAMLAPAERTAAVTTSSKPREHANPDRLLPSRAPVIGAEQVPPQPASLNRTERPERRETRAEVPVIRTTPASSAPTERTFGNRRTQPGSPPALTPPSAQIVSRPAPRTVPNSQTAPASRTERPTRTERSSGFGERPSAMQSPTRSAERTSPLGLAAPTSALAPGEMPDRKPSRNRSWP